MRATAIASLAQVIGYPEEVPSDASVYSFVVDDVPIEAVEENGRLVLTCELSVSDDVDLARFAGYAAGRCLREEAVLAFDPTADRLVLWQDVPARAEPALLRRFFEVFMASCDWWQARADDAESVASIPDMLIRP